MWEVAGKVAGDEAALKRAGEALAGQKEFEFASRVLTEAGMWREFERRQSVSGHRKRGSSLAS